MSEGGKSSEYCGIDRSVTLKVLDEALSLFDMLPKYPFSRPEKREFAVGDKVRIVKKVVKWGGGWWMIRRWVSGGLHHRKRGQV